MARIRTIKPEFWGHRKTARISRDARLLFLGLINLADDEGRLLGSTKSISGALFPNDDDVTDKSVVKWIGELEEAGLARRYSVDAITYVILPGFREHQRVSHPSPSRFPPEPLANDSGIAPEVLRPDQGTGIKEQGSGNGDAYASDFEDLWSEYPRREDKSKALRAYQARRRQGIDHYTLIRSVRNYAQSVIGTDVKFVKLGGSFLNHPGGPWSEWVDGPPGADVQRRLDPTGLR